MRLFSLHTEKSNELQPFPHIVEFSKKKIQSVQPDSIDLEKNFGLRFIFVQEGNFEWVLNEKSITVYPNDLVIIYPNQVFGSKMASFDNGTFYSITILPQIFNEDKLMLGKWCSISITEQLLIGKLFLLHKRSVFQNFKIAGEIFKKIEQELFSAELGFKAMVNHLLDELILYSTRQLNRQENQRKHFPQTFHKFDQILRENLSHPWTVEEMASILGLGTTTLNEKIKAYSGFSPLNYLINLRISESIRLLKNTNVSITDIAFEMGFYSSQHFSSTFKKMTGYTPRYFRKTPDSKEESLNN